MSGTGSRGLCRVSKGSKGIAKRGGHIRATTTTMRSSGSAPVAIPPLATGRGRIGQQQRVAGIFLPPPGRRRPIGEKDADSVVELMVDEQATISSGTEPSTPATTPVRRSSSSSSRPPLHEEEELSSPAPAANISSMSLSSLRVVSSVVADLEEGEGEMLMGTLGEDALDSQTVVTVKQPMQAAAEEEFVGSSSQQDLFEEGEDDDDDRVEDRDWVAPPGDVSSSEEEEDASAGLARRISIADIASRARSGRGMQDPQSASLASSARTPVARTTLQPPPTTTGRPVPVPVVSAPSGRKGQFTSPIWHFFSLPSVDSKHAICNHCRAQLSRGADPSKYGTSSLVTHLAGKHFHEHEEFMKMKTAGAGSAKPTTTAQPPAAAATATRPPPPPPAAAPAGVRKRTALPPSATPAADTEAYSGSQSSVSSSAPSTASHASKKRRQTLLSETFQGVVRVLPPSSRRVRQLNGLLARAMCSQLLPYSLVQEGSDMRALLVCAAPDWRIPSRHFFSRTAIPALHSSVMANVGRGLEHAVGQRVHVTMDSWSSRFGTGRYLSFTAHWVALVEGGEEGPAASGTAAATQWVVPPRRVRAGSSAPQGTPAQTSRLSSSVKPRHCQALLELVSLGKTKLTANHVLAKLREQERSWLSPRGLKVGEVVSDNGANLVAAISRGDLTHIPCLAHVLNLVVHKFLRTYQGMDHLLDAAREVVRHFRRSPAAAASLEEVQKELHLPQHRLMMDVPTRWNSTLAMLERLVEQRQAVNQYIGQATVASIAATGHASNLPSIISNEDWGHMRQVCSVLAPFLQATNMVSRDHAMVCEWVPLVCLLDQALFALLEEGEAALDQQELQAAAQTSSEEEEASELVEVPDLAAEEGEQHSAAGLVRGWREDVVVEESEEDSTVDSGAADVPADIARLFPMAAHMLWCLRRDPRVIQMRRTEDIWITMMLDPRLKGKLSQFLPAGGDQAQQMRDLQRSLVERLEEAFPQLAIPTVQPAQRQQQVPAPTTKRTKDLLSLSHDLYHRVELPGSREEVAAATSSSTHTQRLTRMVADYMGSFSGLDSDAPVDPMEYWVKRLEIWSELAQYALEVLSCPPSSVLSERCFSAAGGVVTEKRSRLSHKSVDRLTFLKMNQAWVEGDFLAPVVGERRT